MAAFTAKDVQALRQRTGVGMMDCKKALTEAEGDMDKAIELLREKGLAAAAKKAGRIAAEGLVVSVIDEAKKAGVVLEVNAETDFVAKNKDFVAFVNAVATTVLNEAPADVEALNTLKLDGTDMTVEEALRDKILTIGENIKIRRFERMEGDLVSYVHGEGKIGVMVKFDTDLADKPEFKAYGKDVAMQIAAAFPQYLNRDEVPSEVLEKEKEILTVQAMNEGKPAAIAEKMVNGRINKYYKEVCLLDQPFVKDGDVNISQYTANTAKELGGKIEVVKFIRFEKGEGIEKRNDNFADEVAGMIQ
ncbi:translation elongation factor Ts [[Clostridium] methylpentosum DSM 5476]|uniref:Elongation factor Ts n=1 Tax=[Clostridium] methylpentosum DSM 5476 TaxID=537013 RepID=C0EEQ9_9FIRM|nr:translation elongation factor Ts [[Clostridium] methylpentosum DSM 5476]MDY3989491.1 translation elongation factor Ts [Massilioclostridium sp.]MEE1491082.1 translation elongation factor Ts [Massilioclostridium sp.]